MAFSNVSLNDTFATWLTRTNQLVIAYNSLEANNALGASGTANAGIIQANTARVHANSSYDQANSVYSYSNTIYLHANSSYDQANTVYDYSNTIYLHANSSYDQANSSYIHANSSFEKANDANSYAFAGIVQANTARDHANVAFGQANSTNLYAFAGIVQANTARVHANAAFDKANAAFANATGVFSGTIILSSNGTSTAPVITHLANTTTGMYFPSQNTMAFSTASNTVVYMSPTGNVGISTTNTSYKLFVAGDIYATGDLVAYSDLAIKKDIFTIENALDIVKNLRGVRYVRRDTEQKRIGLVAQEVQEILPEVVLSSENNIGVNYPAIVSVLIEAIKELKLKVDKLERDN